MKTKLVIFILTAGVSALSAQSEERQRPQRPDPAQIFKTADTNEDGFLDLKEMAAFRATMNQGRRGGQGGGNRPADAENDAPPPREGGQGRQGGRQMPTAEEMLASMDKNEDGKVAPDEFTLDNRRGRSGPGGPGGNRAQRPE